MAEQNGREDRADEVNAAHTELTRLLTSGVPADSRRAIKYIAELIGSQISEKAMTTAIASNADTDNLMHAASAADQHDAQVAHINAALEAGAKGILIPPVVQAIKEGASVKSARRVLTLRDSFRQESEKTHRDAGIPINEIAQTITALDKSDASTPHLRLAIRHEFYGQAAVDLAAALPRVRTRLGENDDDRFTRVVLHADFMARHGIGREHLPVVTQAIEDTDENVVARAIQAGAAHAELPYYSKVLHEVSHNPVGDPKVVARQDSEFCQALKGYHESAGRYYPRPRLVYGAIHDGDPPVHLIPLMVAGAEPVHFEQYGRIRIAADGKLADDTDLSRTKMVANIAQVDQLSEDELPSVALAVAGPDAKRHVVRKALWACRRSGVPGIQTAVEDLNALREQELNVSLRDFTTALKAVGPKGRVNADHIRIIRAFKGTDDDVEKSGGHSALNQAVKSNSGEKAAWAYIDVTDLPGNAAIAARDLVALVHEQDQPYVSAVITMYKEWAESTFPDVRERSARLVRNLEGMKPIIPYAYEHGFTGPALGVFIDGAQNVKPARGLELSQALDRLLNGCKGKTSLERATEFHITLKAIQTYGEKYGNSGQTALGRGARGTKMLLEAASIDAGVPDLGKFVQGRSHLRRPDERYDAAHGKYEEYLAHKDRINGHIDELHRVTREVDTDFGAPIRREYRGR